MSFWNGRTVFLTGGTGLMGGWLMKRLIDEGAEVVALVRDRVPRSMVVSEGILDRAVVVNGSLADLNLLRRAMAEYSVDTTFHLAAQPLVGVAKMHPVETLEVNVRGTWNVLEAARHAGVRQVVVASSDKAYGNSKVLPYTEMHPLQGTYPYDVSKSCADLITRMYAVTFGLPAVVVRCANLYGGGDLNFNRAIPGAIEATLKGERFAIRSDGKCVRDFLYVKDAAAGYIYIARKLAEDRSLAGEAFNLSLGERLTVMDVVTAVLQVMDRTDLEPIVLNEASGEIREQYMISDKARSILGWSPRYTFEDGLKETVAWYRKYFDCACREIELSAGV